MAPNRDEYIVHGKPLNHKLLTGNVSQAFLDAMEKNKSLISQIDPVRNMEWTHGEFRQKTIRVALEMRARGIGAGDIVAICGRNTMEIYLPFVATLYLGATASPLHPQAGEFPAIFRLIEPKMIFTETICEGRISSALKSLNLTTEIVNMDKDFAAFLTPKVGEEYFEAVPVNAEEANAVISFTSGTTGAIKGVPLTHQSFGISMFESEKYRITDEVILIYSPLCWGSGVKTLARGMMSGATRIIVDYNVAKNIYWLDRFKVTYTMLAPYMLIEMIRHPDFKKYDIPSHVRYLLFGGSPIGADQLLEVRKIFHKSFVFNGYGSTEMCSVHALFDRDEDDLNKKKNISVGKLILGISGKIIDVETHELLPRNKMGEICLKGPAMTKGYYKNPEATAFAFDADGYFHTGDIGYFDEDDCLYITGRIKELLKYRSMHISPSTIEDLLLQHPAVEESCVVGVPHELFGDLPLAFVVKKKNCEVTAEEIIKFVADRVSDYEQLRGGVRFTDALPRTPTGKVRRNELSKLVV